MDEEEVRGEEGEDEEEEPQLNSPMKQRADDRPSRTSCRTEPCPVEFGKQGSIREGGIECGSNGCVKDYGPGARAKHWEQTRVKKEKLNYPVLVIAPRQEDVTANVVVVQVLEGSVAVGDVALWEKKNLKR